MYMQLQALAFKFIDYNYNSIDMAMFVANTDGRIWLPVLYVVMAGRDPLGRIEASDECRMPCHFARPLFSFYIGSGPNLKRKKPSGLQVRD